MIKKEIKNYLEELIKNIERTQLPSKDDYSLGWNDANNFTLQEITFLLKRI